MQLFAKNHVVAWDSAMWFLGADPSRFAYDAWWHWAGVYGITEENFGTWLRDADSYSKVWAFLVQGAHERLWEFVESSRYFKVLGLFLIGAWIGRMKVFARLDELKPQIKTTASWCIGIGLPMSGLYAMCGVGAIEVEKPVKSLIYLLSVYPLGFGYCALFALAYICTKGSRFWRVFAFPGRMALSNYVGQSVFGILIFYGIGLGLGASLGLAATAVVALTVFLVEIILSAAWLHYFNYGPLEWLWRMWNYNKYLPILKQTK